MNFTRPKTVWTLFAFCLSVLLLAMGWLTTHALRLEEDRLRAEVNRELQERTRLALWRMDSAAGALVFAESARLPFHFKDFAELDQVYTSDLQIVRRGLLRSPSPLLNTIPAHAKLYFQMDAEGRCSSPQVPQGNYRDLAEQSYVPKETIDSAAALLKRARQLFLADPVGPSQAHARRSVSQSLAQGESSEEMVAHDGMGQDGSIPQSSAQGESWLAEERKNQGEFESRSRSLVQNKILAAFANEHPKILTTNEAVLQQAAAAGVRVTMRDTAESFQGSWKEGELFLVRQARLDGSDFTQAVWLDVPVIRDMLLAEVRDLLPEATLTPVVDMPADASTTNSVAAHARNLASLPFRLEPGEVVGAMVSFWSPLRRSLATAWACVLGSALVAGILVYRIVNLSERRGAFVSAVTHEMRTPLTTFRLYSEMLSCGMVKDPVRQSAYLSTLTCEADRLSHLVENVLTYARLEKGSARAQVEETSLQSIIDRVKPRLDQRAAQDGMVIQVDADTETAKTRVKVDLTAVEQILFNLVDNACKYGREPSGGDEGENVIHLEADADGLMALLRVRDHGRGISRSEKRRLFRPFEKSADEAARTAHGVGLGLALCRKLSRALGGDLRLCGRSDGACFILALPALDTG